MPSDQADSAAWGFGTSLVLVLGFALRCAFLHEQIGDPVWWLNFLDGVDTATHLGMAKSILADRWLSGLGGFYQSPLYPYVLAGLHRMLAGEPVAIAYAQAVMSALASLVTARMAAAALGPRAGFVAALLMSLAAPAVFYPMYFLPATLEMLAAALSLATLSGALRNGGTLRWAWAGLAWGIAWMARPNVAAAGLVAAAVHALVARPPRASLARPALAFVVAAVLAVSPLAVRNLKVGGHLGLLPTSGEANYKIGNSEDSLVAGFAYPEKPLIPPFSFAMLRHQAGKLLAFFWGFEIPQNVNYYMVREGSSILSLPLLGLEVLAGLAAIGVAAWRRPMMPAVLAWTLAYAASISFFFVVGRFRIPALPALAFVGAAALLELRERLGSDRVTSAAVLMTVGAALTVAASSGLPERKVRPNDYFNALQASWTRMRPSALRELARRGARDYPDMPDMRALYAATLVDANDPAALPEIEAALRMDPRNVRALLSALAWNVRRKGDPRTIEAIRAELLKQGVMLPKQF